MCDDNEDSDEFLLRKIRKTKENAEEALNSYEFVQNIWDNEQTIFELQQKLHSGEETIQLANELHEVITKNNKFIQKIS